jgi:hypothetical protein
VVVSDAALARHILLTNAANYSKGLLSEILDFVMGKGAPRGRCRAARPWRALAGALQQLVLPRAHVQGACLVGRQRVWAHLARARATHASAAGRRAAV